MGCWGYQKGSILVLDLGTVIKVVEQKSQVKIIFSLSPSLPTKMSFYCLSQSITHGPLFSFNSFSLRGFGLQSWLHCLGFQHFIHMILASFTYPGAVIKYPDKTRLKGGGVYLLLRVQFIMAAEEGDHHGDSNPRQLVTLHLKSGIRELALSSLSPLTQS